MHPFLREVNRYRSRRSHTSRISVRWETTRIVDDIVRMKCLKLLPCRSNEHITHKECMICPCTHNSNTDTVALVPACITIDNVDAVTSIQIVDGTFSIDTPYLLELLAVGKGQEVGRHAFGSIGLLTGPHHISLSDISSLTILLSDGERPVFAPEYAERAPDEVMAEPVS